MHGDLNGGVAMVDTATGMIQSSHWKLEVEASRLDC